VRACGCAPPARGTIGTCSTGAYCRACACRSWSRSWAQPTRRDYGEARLSIGGKSDTSGEFPAAMPVTLLASGSAAARPGLSPASSAHWLRHAPAERCNVCTGATSVQYAARVWPTSWKGIAKNKSRREELWQDACK
jgi:hypothetical protein